MKPEKLLKADLNLMVVFAILMEEKNVTRAAERLLISQPAMSKTLRKMRLMFDDELFTRAAHGLVPTPRAKELQKQVQPLLSQMEHLLYLNSFDPATYKGNFTLASSDFCLQYISGHLKTISDQAPGIKIHHSAIEPDFCDALITGEIDFALHAPQKRRDGLVMEEVKTCELIGLMRKNHPLSAKKSLTLEEFLSYPQIRHFLPKVTESGVGVIDEMLADLSLQRKIILETPYLLIGLEELLQTNCLMVVGEKLNLDELYRDKFSQFSLPVELQTKRKFCLYYHERVNQSEAHQWFRKLIIQSL